MTTKTSYGSIRGVALSSLEKKNPVTGFILTKRQCEKEDGRDRGMVSQQELELRQDL